MYQPRKTYGNGRNMSLNVKDIKLIQIEQQSKKQELGMELV